MPVLVTCKFEENPITNEDNISPSLLEKVLALTGRITP